jgi:hypothetical protein
MPVSLLKFSHCPDAVAGWPVMCESSWDMLNQLQLRLIVGNICLNEISELPTPN